MADVLLPFINSANLELALTVFRDKIGFTPGEDGGGGTIIAGAQIDDTDPSFSRVYSSQKTVDYILLAIQNAISNMDGLSDNNFSTAEKLKLARIERDANYYVHPLTHPASIIETNEDRQFVTGLEKDIFADKYTRDEIDNLIAQITSGFIWKSEVPRFSDIATTYPNPAYNWCVPTNDGTFLYDGSEWIKIGSGIVPLATSSTSGLLSPELYTKLNGIAAGANKYSHPSTHSAGMIEETTKRKFVTPEMYTKLVELDDALDTLLSKYRLKATKILETDLDQDFLDKVANAGGTIINDGIKSLAQTYSSIKIEDLINNYKVSVMDIADVNSLFAD